MKAILNHLFDQKTFNKDDSKEILKNIALGKYNVSQMAAFMTAYGMRSITVDELQGFRDAMLELCLPVNLTSFTPSSPTIPNAARALASPLGK